MERNYLKHKFDIKDSPLLLLLLFALEIGNRSDDSSLILIQAQVKGPKIWVISNETTDKEFK